MPRGVSRYDEARLQRQLWTPSQIPKSQMAVWYDFADLSTIGSAASNLVDTVKDKSGNGFNLSSSGSARPVYSPRGLNGRSPGLVYSGAQCLTSVPNTIGDTKWAAFCIVQYADTNGYTRVISGNDSASGADYNGGNGLGFLQRGNAGAECLITRYSSDLGSSYSPYLWSATGPAFVGTAVCDGALNTVYNNGRAGTPVSFVSSTITPYEYAVGATAGTAGGITGTISECLVLHGGITTRLQQLIEGYLFHRHQVISPFSQNMFMGSHPFINRPPLIGD